MYDIYTATMGFFPNSTQLKTVELKIPPIAFLANR